jgi:hypothetical protein
MTPNFLLKIKNGTACCYLRLWPANLKMWNFMAAGSQVFNTHLLFKASARPHFNYFFEAVDYFGLQNAGDLSLVDDAQFKTQLESRQGSFISPVGIPESLAAWLKEKKLNAVVISDGQTGIVPGFSGLPQIKLKGLELFGNTEPVWLGLKNQLPKNVDIFFLVLGEEKFLIGPRLKLIFGKPVVDIAEILKPKDGLARKAKSFLKNLTT